MSGAVYMDMSIVNNGLWLKNLCEDANADCRNGCNSLQNRLQKLCICPILCYRKDAISSKKVEQILPQDADKAHPVAQKVIAKPSKQLEKAALGGPATQKMTE